MLPSRWQSGQYKSLRLTLCPLCAHTLRTTLLTPRRANAAARQATTSWVSPASNIWGLAVPAICMVVVLAAGFIGALAPSDERGESPAAYQLAPVSLRLAGEADSASLEPLATPPASASAGAQNSPAQSITAVGDSVMLAAAQDLVRLLGPLDLDAAVGRQAREAIDILRSRRDGGTLGSTVVVHIGHNGPVGVDQVEEMMGLLAEVPRVLLLNVNLPRPWEEANNVLFATAAARHSNVRLLDWAAATEGRAELFWEDEVHLSELGAAAYADVVARNLVPMGIQLVAVPPAVRASP
jgi:hypothetical protein